MMWMVAVSLLCLFLILKLHTRLAGPVISPLLLRTCVNEAQADLLEAVAHLEDHQRARTLRRAVFVSLAATHAELQDADWDQLRRLLSELDSAPLQEIDALAERVWDHLSAPRVAATRRAAHRGVVAHNRL